MTQKSVIFRHNQEHRIQGDRGGVHSWPARLPRPGGPGPAAQARSALGRGGERTKGQLLVVAGTLDDSTDLKVIDDNPAR